MKCVHVRADVAVEADVERVVATAVDTFGRLDGAFNNASPGGGILKALADFTTEEVDDPRQQPPGVWLCMRAEIGWRCSRSRRAAA